METQKKKNRVEKLLQNKLSKNVCEFRKLPHFLNILIYCV